MTGQYDHPVQTGTPGNQTSGFESFLSLTPPLLSKSHRSNVPSYKADTLAPFSFPWIPTFPSRGPPHPHSFLPPDMTTVQDHGPVIKELSDKRQQDPQPILTSQLQTTSQQTPPRTRDISDAPRPHTGTSETLQEHSPPRSSQLPGTFPEPNLPRRRPSTATNPSALGNHPDTTSGPNYGTGQMSNVTPGLRGKHHAPTV